MPFAYLPQFSCSVLSVQEFRNSSEFDEMKIRTFGEAMGSGAREENFAWKGKP